MDNQPQPSGLIRSHETEFAFMYRIVDITAIFVAFFTLSIFFEQGLRKDDLILISSACLVFLVLAESSNLYRSWRTNKLKTQLFQTTVVWLFTYIVMTLVLLAANASNAFQPSLILTWLGVALAGLLLWRIGFRLALNHVRQRGFNTRRAIIIGQTELGIRLAKEIETNNEHGVILDGFYDERGSKREDWEQQYPIKGSLVDALARAKNSEIDYVYIAMPMFANDRISLFLKKFSDTTATTYLVPDFFTYNLLHSRWNQIGSVQTLSVFDTPFSGAASWLKRLEDIVIGSIILLCISPILLVISAGVKLTSPGPVLFKQDRYGLDGRKIKVWKFRSMTTMEQGSDVKQATKNDPRITPFGSFLRRTSLDELPQFFNVLQGTMSIVGPRPHAISHNEEYRQIVDRYMLRHKVKPGITGWAQVNGFRGETDTLEKMEKRVEFDLKYIHDWNIWMDVKIIFLTFFKGFTGSNAY
ncbi:undecaprenyl-phosphate glucose phosphotransferase [Vibrio maerlii]|uniref:undecaprenyl-phosphate glucose phosphotransferase n=1 Tax=Vibrio maerlii TaxID=2231648 RepID=UPI000E3C6649|nr:undecaprenyl-phosphate glucose phosphotransferase [Vibrio maerlii]